MKVLVPSQQILDRLLNLLQMYSTAQFNLQEQIYLIQKLKVELHKNW